jgi:hypothetical protein
VLWDTLLVPFRFVANIFNMVNIKGCSDFPQWVKQTVCESIYWCSSEDERAAALINQQLPTRRGRPSSSCPDTMTRAFRAFAQSPWDTEEEEAIANTLTRKQFNYIANAHYAKYLVSRRVKPRARTAPVRQLSVAQRELAARILGTPVFVDGYLKFFAHAQDAAAASPAFLRLAKIACMPLDAFAKYLCEQCPDIVAHKKVDVVEELNPCTLQARRAAADVWAGRAVWRQASTAGPRGGSVNNQGVRPVSWRYGSGSCAWPYYSTFTFMLDAATMSSGDRQPEMLRRKVFQRIDVRYPPEVLHARDSVGSQVWVMFYLVVHPLFGVLSGPDFMYWGSKTVRGATRHSQDFKCWYEHPN